ncbi:MAG: hypothetical protein KF857_02785 [Fimbriimonadaceae bacterium]|nr:hypothetical protein [Fimbriimonadaceae bacterium]
MLGVVYTSTLKDFLRPGRLVVWGLVSVVVGLLCRVWTGMSGGMPADVAYGVATSNVVFRLVALAAAIFAPMVVSQEVEQKTIIYWLTRAVPRPVTLVGRSLAAVTASGVVTVMVSVCVAFGVRGGLGGTFLPDLAIALVGAAAYCSLFVMFSLLVNRALVWCLLFAFGWETFVPNMPGMAALSFHTHMSRLLPDPKEAPDLDPIAQAVQTVTAVDVKPAVAWAVLAVSAVGLLALASWWFSVKEFAPREDTE